MSEKFCSKKVDENWDGLDVSHSILTPKRLEKFCLFLRSVAKLRKEAVIIVVMSVCLSVCQQGKTRLPLDGFSQNFVFEYIYIYIYFWKICRENSSVIKI